MSVPGRKLVLPDTALGRLDALLAGLLDDVSRRRLKTAFREGRVLLEGRAVRGCEDALPGATVEIRGLPAWEEAGCRDTRPIELEIVHLDEALVVVEKPAGAPSYPLEPGEGGTVAESVLALFPDMAGVGDLPGAPGLCHRLDVETSGLLLFARTEEVFQELRRRFRERLVHKYYLAVVAGDVNGRGYIDVPIGRRSSKRMIAPAPEGSRAWEARTSWRTIERTADRSVLELKLETGVTHQARVHLAWMGHPIVGDEVYGGPAAPRLGLHAFRLGLTHPLTGRQMNFTSRADGEVRALLREG